MRKMSLGREIDATGLPPLTKQTFIENVSNDYFAKTVKKYLKLIIFVKIFLES